MHDDARDPKPMGADFPTIFENEWFVQRRRILFMTLISWFVYLLPRGKGFVTTH